MVHEELIQPTPEQFEELVNLMIIVIKGDNTEAHQAVKKVDDLVTKYDDVSLERAKREAESRLHLSKS